MLLYFSGVSKSQNEFHKLRCRLGPDLVILSTTVRAIFGETTWNFGANPAFTKKLRGGPIEAKLLKYGAVDGLDAHAAVGLVLGTFDMLSTSCYSLCTSIARVAAARLLGF